MEIEQEVQQRKKSLLIFVFFFPHDIVINRKNELEMIGLTNKERGF